MNNTCLVGLIEIIINLNDQLRAAQAEIERLRNESGKKEGGGE